MNVPIWKQSLVIPLLLYAIGIHLYGTASHIGYCPLGEHYPVSPFDITPLMYMVAAAISPQVGVFTGFIIGVISGRLWRSLLIGLGAELLLFCLITVLHFSAPQVLQWVD